MDEKILQAIEDLTMKMDKSIGALEQKIDQSIEVINFKIDESIEGLRSDFNDKIDTLSSQINENTQILKALEHLAQVNKAEHDKLTFDMAEIKGDVKCIQRDLATVQLVTADNWSDIVKLKSVK